MACRSWEYTGVVTRQVTGPAKVPSSRLRSTVSMTVPSSNLVTTPPDTIGPVMVGSVAPVGAVRVVVSADTGSGAGVAGGGVGGVTGWPLSNGGRTGSPPP